MLPPSIDTAMQRHLQGLDECDFPLVPEWRERQRSGGVLNADRAADLILDEALADDADTVLDLSTQ